MTTGRKGTTVADMSDESTTPNEPKGMERFQSELARSRYEDLMVTQDIAKVFMQAGIFKDVDSVAQAMVKVMAGGEIGLDPFASMNAFDIIKGKVEMTANTQAALVKAHPRYDYRVKELDNDHAAIDFFENGKWIGTSTFTMQDAKKAGITSQTWEKFPRNMLFARAMTNGTAWFCPDLSPVRLYAPAEVGGPEPEDDAIRDYLKGAESPYAEDVVEDLARPSAIADRFKDAETIPFDPDTGEIIEGDNADFGGLDQEAVEQIVSGEDTGAGGASSSRIGPFSDTEPEPEGNPAEAVGGAGVASEPTTEQEPEPGAGGTDTTPAPDEGGTAEEPWTAAQRSAIFGINRNLGWSKEELNAFAKRDSLSTLTKHEATELIEALLAVAKEKGV